MCEFTVHMSFFNNVFLKEREHANYLNQVLTECERLHGWSAPTELGLRGRLFIVLSRLFSTPTSPHPTPL